MKSSFFEYQVAMSGLFTARANLNIVGHNIANAAMPGYSRQVSIQKASRPLTLNNGKGMYGTGSEVYGVRQIRDIYLDRKYWSQKAILGEYTTKNDHLAMMETVFNDLGDTGIRTAFTDFFSRLQDLTTNTPDATYRTNVIMAADTLAEMIRTNAEALQKQQIDLNQEVEGVVERINSLGAQITSLNRQIYQYEIDGSNANDLRDQRARLVDELSEYVNVSVEERDYSREDLPYDKRFTLQINGYDFVNHFDNQSLVCVPRDDQRGTITIDGKEYPTGTKKNIMDVPNLYDLYIDGTGTEFDIYSPTLQGTLKGIIDVRDGNNGDMTMPDGAPAEQTTTYKGVPFYLNKLNSLCRVFARAINEGRDAKGNEIPDVTGHMTGYDKYAIDTGTPSGRLLITAMSGATDQLKDPMSGDLIVIDFPNTTIDANITADYDGVDYGALNCLNIAVNPELTEDPYLLACNSAATIGESNNDVILGFT
ncbi:MAG: flagellar hook-associated protein FlgK, partial [Clostridiales bacterium]|nr:flagellar hook-associated protein FlgK [Clostridiales bacterium]